MLPRCRSGFSCKSATSCCARRRLCRSAVKARGNKSAGFCSCCRRMTLRCGRALRRAHSPRGSAELQPCGSVARCMLYVVGCTLHVVHCRLHAVGCTPTALARHSTHARTPLDSRAELAAVCVGGDLEALRDAAASPRGSAPLRCSMRGRRLVRMRAWARACACGTGPRRRRFGDGRRTSAGLRARRRRSLSRSAELITRCCC